MVKVKEIRVSRVDWQKKSGQKYMSVLWRVKVNDYLVQHLTVCSSGIMTGRLNDDVAPIYQQLKKNNCITVSCGIQHSHWAA